MSRWLLPLVLFCASCSTFQRSTKSGYADDGRKSETSSIQGSTGDLSSTELDAIEKRRRVRQLEATLESRREREQYSKMLPWLNSDDEKIDFLSLGSVEARQEWAHSRGIWQRAQTLQKESRDLIEAGDIAVGMTKDHVRKSWGEPQAVEVSGNPLYHNERWRYIRQVSGQDGYRQERRFVYFEGGRVVGWETE